MTTTERNDLVNAVLASRDDLDADLETDLLEAIVDAEAGSAGDGEAAMRTIDTAVTAAIERDVGNVQKPESASGESAGHDGEQEKA